MWTAVSGGACTKFEVVERRVSQSSEKRGAESRSSMREELIQAPFVNERVGARLMMGDSLSCGRVGTGTFPGW